MLMRPQKNLIALKFINLETLQVNVFCINFIHSNPKVDHIKEN
jgi:hypothetical protein